MNDPVAWVIALVFYGPMHYLGPLALVFLTGKETAGDRRRLSHVVLVDCTVSIAVAFGVAVWLFSDRLPIAMGVLLLSMVVPYLHILVVRRPKT